MNQNETRGLTPMSSGGIPSEVKNVYLRISENV